MNSRKDHRHWVPSIGRYMATGMVGVALSVAVSAVFAQPVPVVASFSILGDMVSVVGGDAIDVSTLIGPNADAHAFEPRPGDARKLADAKLLIVNGLQFEPWLAGLVQSTGYTGPQIEASTGIEPLDNHEHGHDDHDHDAHHEHEHQHGEKDPHAWQSLSNAVVYVENIRDALAEVAPEAATQIHANAANYIQQLQQLDTQAKQQLSAIPEAHRRAMVSHDALAYFGQAYGIEFLPLLGMSSQAEPSAREVAELVKRAKDEQISAIFLENSVNPALAKQLARETGARMGGTLYTDALAEPNHEAGTYLGMMQSNLRAVEAALKP